MPMALRCGILSQLLLWASCAAAFGQTTAPPAPTAKLADVCRLHVVKGLLQLDSDVPANVNIVDAPKSPDGSYTLDITRGGTDALNTFDLQLNRQTSEYELAVGLMVQGNQLRMQYDATATSAIGSERFISLGQNMFMFGAKPPGLQPPLSLSLRQQMRRWGGGPQIRASSFDELITNYPQEREQYLRPMLRELHQEDLLPPANLEALQVFADDLPPDPQKAKQINDLVAQLDADSSDDRDAATEKLKVMQGDAILALTKLDRSTLSPEQTARVDGICRDFKPLTPDEIQAKRKDVKFLLMALASDEEPIRIAALKALHAVSDQSFSFDTGGNPIDRSLALTDLHSQLLPTVGN
jgi:hypothetical protein